MVLRFVKLCLPWISNGLAGVLVSCSVLRVDRVLFIFEDGDFEGQRTG